jgi:hypothetical protein
LIYNDFSFCFFYGQFDESLDFQGIGGRSADISTKLSTEILDVDQIVYGSKT